MIMNFFIFLQLLIYQGLYELDDKIFYFFLFFLKKYLNIVKINIIIGVAKDKKGEENNGINKKYIL